MDLLFTVSNPSSESTIQDSDFKQHYASINRSLAWDSIEPFIRQATKEYLIPYLGQIFYDYVADEAHTADIIKSIRELARDVVAYYTIWLAMPHINIVISDMGTQESSNENSQPAQMWRYKNTRWETMRHADDLLDALLKLMEDNKDNAELATWKASTEYTSIAHDLYRTTSIFAQYTNIRSRRAFRTLLPFIDQALDLDIKDHVCSDQYDDLITKLKAGTLNSYESALIDLIRKATANWTLYRAIPHIRVTFESNALVFVTSTDGMNIRKEALDSAIASLRSQLQDNAKSYTAKIREYLYTNVDQFAIFKSNGYVQFPGVIASGSIDGVGGIIVH